MSNDDDKQRDAAESNSAQEDGELRRRSVASNVRSPARSRSRSHLRSRSRSPDATRRDDRDRDRDRDRDGGRGRGKRERGRDRYYSRRDFGGGAITSVVASSSSSHAPSLPFTSMMPSPFFAPFLLQEQSRLLAQPLPPRQQHVFFVVAYIYFDQANYHPSPQQWMPVLRSCRANTWFAHVCNWCDNATCRTMRWLRILNNAVSNSANGLHVAEERMFAVDGARPTRTTLEFQLGSKFRDVPSAAAADGRSCHKPVCVHVSLNPMGTECVCHFQSAFGAMGPPYMGKS